MALTILFIAFIIFCIIATIAVINNEIQKSKNKKLTIEQESYFEIGENNV